jgi:altronate dehydratase small subunit
VGGDQNIKEAFQIYHQLLRNPEIDVDAIIREVFGNVETKEEIPFGHKVALRKIAKGRAVIKYGEHIGKAVRTIAPGELVHTHNVEGERGKGRKQD